MLKESSSQDNLSHGPIEEEDLGEEPIHSAHSDLPSEDVRRTPPAETESRLAAARDAARRREKQADDLEPSLSGDPIEEEDLGEEPIESAHSGEPGEGPKRALSAKMERRLEAKRAAARAREQQADRLETPIHRSSFHRGDEASGMASAIAEGGVRAGSVPDLTPQDFVVALARSPLIRDKAILDDLRLCKDYESAFTAAKKIRRRELPFGTDPNDLKATGWGVIFARGADPKVKYFLQPLLDRRQKQAGKRYKELIYNPPESARSFLWHRHGVSPGVLDTQLMPYYLLIVGDPETIPFTFQYLLQINHSVGRIYFEDPEDYRRYAKGVVEAEDQRVDRTRRAVFFSVENDDDETTAQMAEYMVSPLAASLKRDKAGLEVEIWSKDKAYKKDLRKLLGGESTPELLLVACHGIRCSPGDPQQEDHQGALLCQDWQGPEKCPDVNARHYFHVADLSEGARLNGQIAFLHACYSAGTPLEDDFPQEEDDTNGEQQPRMLALRPFVGRLPQMLLARGALAVVGHVDRGWTLSFSWTSYGKHIEAVKSLEDALKRLTDGQRLGEAMRPLFRRYSALGANLLDPLDRLRRVGEFDESLEKLISFEWTAYSDARNVIVLGDPAVQLSGGITHY